MIRRLAIERKTRKIKAYDLARIIGVGVATVYRWERFGTSFYNQGRYKTALAAIAGLQDNKKRVNNKKQKPRLNNNKKSKKNNNNKAGK